MRRHSRVKTGVLAGAAVAALIAAPVPAVGAAVPGSDIAYTTSADFAKGTLVNLNADAVGDQLQLNKTTSTFPFIWIALSDRETIAKIDTRTGAIRGEYRGLSEGAGSHATSRTTVMLDGSVWFGHRFTSVVTHVGLAESNQCVDRNGNGVIDTSTGYGDVRAWPGGTNGAPSAVSNAADECILATVNTPGDDSRHLSVDRDGNIWVGHLAGGHGFVKLDGRTGQFLLGDANTAHRSFACGGYGGLIDRSGVLWSSNGGSNGLLRWDLQGDPSGAAARCLDVPVYGLAIDPAGNIWVNEYGASVRKVAPDGTVLGTFPNGQIRSQGLAVDSTGDVWISSSLNCSSDCTVSHLTNDGVLVGLVPTPTGAGSTGIAVDASGKLWAANINSSTATRIDATLGADSATVAGKKVGAVDLTVNLPATIDDPAAHTIALPAAHPYNYSDMTGNVALTSTSQQGSWTVVQDAGAGREDFNWHTISFNNEKAGHIPPGGSVTLSVDARAADTEAGLGGRQFQPIENCVVNTTLRGRFLQVRVTLKANAAGQSPVVSDVVIRGGPGVRPGECTRPTETPGPSVVADATLGDFSGDGKADLALFRPGNRTWHVWGMPVIRHGRHGDVPVAADFTGDGRTDIAVFRPTNRTWYVRGMVAVPLGRHGDVPVAADFTGDGKADLGVFRPSTGTWYVRGLAARQLGRRGDVPVAADFTGDGKADLAVFRPSDGTWRVDGLPVVHLGRRGDVPVVGDYTGDGKADYGVFRPTSRTWLLAGQAALHLGRRGDLPVVGDYTGDGKADYGVFRPSNGTWYVRGLPVTPFGRSHDVPLRW